MRRRRERRHTPLGCRVAAALGCAAAAALAAVASPPPDQRFSGEVTVREAAIVVELPPRLAHGGGIDPDELVVVDGGLRCPVLRAQPLVEAPAPGSPAEPASRAEWSILLYFDRRLASDAMVHAAALALAGHAAELAAMGPIDVVLAGAETPTLLGGSRAPRRVSDELAAIAAATAGSGTPLFASRPVPPPGELRRSLDALTARAAERGTAPRLLVLAGSGEILSPASLDALAGRPDEDRAQDVAAGAAGRAWAESTRIVAAYGWTALPLVLRQGPSGRREAADAFERWHELVLGDVPRYDFGVYRWPFRRRPPPNDSATLDVRILPQYLPWRRLAEATAGAVLAHGDQIGPALDRLARRWLVVYRPPEDAPPGLAPIEVRLRATEAPLPARRWSRHATPPAVTGLRLRRLLAGEDGVDDGRPMPMLVGLEAEGEHREALVAIPDGWWPPLSAEETTVAAARPGPDASADLLPARRLRPDEGRTIVRLDLGPVVPAEECVTVALVAEDHRSDAWHGAVLEVPIERGACSEGGAPVRPSGPGGLD